MGKEAVGDHFDVLVVGGGAAGCVVAARLSEDPARSVVCSRQVRTTVIVRPVGGPRICRRRRVPVESRLGDRGWAAFGPARVIGGCTAHNACYVSVGAPSDYDEWEQSETLDGRGRQ